MILRFAGAGLLGLLLTADALSRRDGNGPARPAEAERTTAEATPRQPETSRTAEHV